MPPELTSLLLLCSLELVTIDHQHNHLQPTPPDSITSPIVGIELSDAKEVSPKLQNNLDGVTCNLLELKVTFRRVVFLSSGAFLISLLSSDRESSPFTTAT